MTPVRSVRPPGLFWFTLATLLILGSSFASVAADSFPVVIRVDPAKNLGELRPIWRFFGADEPNYTTMKNGRKLLGELGALAPQQVYFRTHNLFTSGDGTPALKWGSTGIYREGADGAPIYNFEIIDGIFDACLQNGVRPYVELGFMPKDLSTRPEPYQHSWTPRARYNEIYTGWAYPPKDYKKWGELVFAWTRHCLEKYGPAELEHWYFETWNEANIGYWRGTPEEFLKLHDYAVAAVRRALPAARVGGPDTAGHGGKFTRAFLEHCLRGTNFATGTVGTPIDFISFHAKGAPVFTNDHVRMGIANQLRTIDEGFGLIASYPELKGKPIVIGESDPEGCAACQGSSLAYRNGTMYSSYTAASFARKQDLADRHGVNFLGALTWAFEFENQPYFAGFRSLASNGLDKPVLNVFRMFARMRGHRIPVQSDHAVPLETILQRGVRQEPDVDGFASAEGHSIYIMLWHYHDDDLPGPDAEIDLRIGTVPARGARVQHYRIDENHSNAYTAWLRVGSPPQPTSDQYAQLENAGRLQTIGQPETLPPGSETMKFKLPRKAVSLLVVDLL